MSVPWMYCEETVGSVRAELAKLRIQTLGVHVYTQWVHVHLYPKKSLIFGPLWGNMFHKHIPDHNFVFKRNANSGRCSKKTAGAFRCCQLQKCIWIESFWSPRCAWSLWWLCLCCGPEEGHFPTCSHRWWWWKERPSHRICITSTQKHTGMSLKKGNVIQFALCADLTAFTWHSAAPLMLAEFQDIQATQRSLLPGTPAEGLHKSEEIYLKHF